MNSELETSFLKDDSFATVLWTEKMLAEFVNSSDMRLGLNECSAAEKKIMQVLCKSFQINYMSHDGRVFLEKTSDARAPYLSVKDLLTPERISEHFSTFKNKFHDNSERFPCEYMSYKQQPLERGIPKMSQKPTNREMSQHEMSMHSVHSRTSSQSSESLINMQNDKKVDKKSKLSSDSNSKITTPSNEKIPGVEQKESTPNEVAKASPLVVIEESKSIVEAKPALQQATTAIVSENKAPAMPPKVHNDQEEGGGSAKKKKRMGHAIPNRAELPRIKWTRQTGNESLRLPSVYHILFVILERGEEDKFCGQLKDETGLHHKVIRGLGAFVVCDSEKRAKQIFELLEPLYLVYPMKEVPISIQNDQLRSEICFMEGVRPQKSTTIAERFISKHLGFKH